MAQGSGYDNTAPAPIPGGYGNPTGAATGAPGSANYTPIPVGALPTVGGSGGFPAYGTGAGTSTTNPGLASLSSGFSANSPTDSAGNTQLLTQLQNDYGAGMGSEIYQMLSGGLFNPQVAQAMISAMQPQIEQGLVATEGAFAGEGARFSSSAQLGVAGYESQATLGENEVLANMYEQAQTEQLSLMQSVLPSVYQSQADYKSGSILDDILGAVEIAGGAALAIGTGGAAAGLGALIGSQGLNTIAQGNAQPGSGGGGGTSTAGTAALMTQLAAQQNSINASGTNSTNPLSPANSGQINNLNLQDLNQMTQEASAANALGGAQETNTSPSLLEELQEIYQ